MVGAAVTATPTVPAGRGSSNVEVGDRQRVLLDELAAGLDDVGLGDLDPKQRAVGRVERGFPQLLGVHFAEALVALNAEALPPGRKHSLEQFGRASDRQRLALGLGRRLVVAVALVVAGLLCLCRRRAFLE